LLVYRVLFGGFVVRSPDGREEVLSYR